MPESRLSSPSKDSGSRGRLSLSKHQIVMGVLGVVILACIAVAAIQLLTPSTPGPWRYRFQCQQADCLHEFDRAVEGLAGDASPAEQAKVRLDCPKCGVGESSRIVRRCPACRGWYPPAEDGPSICSNCKTNIDEWKKEHPGWRG